MFYRAMIALDRYNEARSAGPKQKHRVVIREAASAVQRSSRNSDL